MGKLEHWTEGFDGFIGTLITGAKDMGRAVEVGKANAQVTEKLARFAHEGLPYMTGDENWFDYNKDWTINVWWNWEEMTYRATAYRKLHEENQEITLDLKNGLDLF